MVAFLYSRWLALSLVTRQAIAKELGIAKTGSTHVVDNRVQSDGYDIATVETALEAHEGTWDEIVARAEGRMAVPGMSFVGALPQMSDDAQVLSPKVLIDDPDNIVQSITVQAVNNAPKKLTVEHLNKKTTRAKPARRKGK